MSWGQVCQLPGYNTLYVCWIEECGLFGVHLCYVKLCGGCYVLISWFMQKCAIWVGMC